MTVEWIEKDGKQFQILYGFGRLQKARSIYAKYLPESMKRAQITNVDISDDELIKKAAPDELANIKVNHGHATLKSLMLATQWFEFDQEVTAIGGTRDLFRIADDA